MSELRVGAIVKVKDSWGNLEARAGTVPAAGDLGVVADAAANLNLMPGVVVWVHFPMSINKFLIATRFLEYMGQVEE